jgi:hypothetical protein
VAPPGTRWVLPFDPIGPSRPAGALSVLDSEPEPAEQDLNAGCPQTPAVAAAVVAATTSAQGVGVSPKVAVVADASMT